MKLNSPSPLDTPEVGVRRFIDMDKNQVLHSAPDADDISYNKVGGWLYLLIFQLVILNPYRFIDIYKTWICINKYISGTSFIIASIPAIGLTIYGIYCGYCLFTLKEKAVSSTIFTLVFLVLAYVFYYFLLYFGGSGELKQFFGVGTIKYFVGIFITSALWTFYLSTSNRVMRTYKDFAIDMQTLLAKKNSNHE